jgi:hypothetical protein
VENEPVSVKSPFVTKFVGAVRTPASGEVIHDRFVVIADEVPDEQSPRDTVPEPPAVIVAESAVCTDVSENLTL